MRGDYRDVTEYGSSPVAAAQRWLEEGAALVHVVDLDGARHGTPAIDTWQAFGRAGVPYQLGGGIRDVAAVEAAVAAGARRVILGTAAVWEPEVLAGAVASVGAERVVASVDVDDGMATGRGWLDGGRPVVEVVEQVQAAGVRQYLVTAVRRDGTMAGPDLDLVRLLLALTGDAYVMCAGGIGSLNHIRAVRLTGAGGVVIGRALYEGAFTLAEAIEMGTDDT